uniref:Uncharacterized protein n=1 Tax=mine drainage metagenome TaxID=410659 RepID=E6PNL7_9ZZZZ
METKIQEVIQKLAVSPGESLFLVGYSRSVETGYKSAANLIWLGEFPFPIRILRVGDREKKVVLVADIEDALRGRLAAQVQAGEVTSPPTRRGPGRPRKGASLPGAAGVKGGV